MNLKERKGITLIALVITIIVLLILAGITISTLTGENGILTQAKQGKAATEISEIKERIETDLLKWQAGSKEDEINNAELKTILEKYFNEIPEDYDKDTEIIAKNEYGGHAMKVSDVYDGTIEKAKTSISKETSYVGCYADIDDDGTVDGIIYADLAIGNTGSGEWFDSDGAYTIPKETGGLKDYYVKNENYTSEKFGNTTAKLIAPIEGSSGTKERFYVMALEDINTGTSYDWYNAAYNYKDSNGNTGMTDYEDTTSVDFGKGKANTTTMISKWNNKEYGEQNQCSSHEDMWGVIQSEVNKGWFVASRAEWSAFAGELGISKDRLNIKYYINLGLAPRYWSSSQRSTIGAWAVYFTSGHISSNYVNYFNYVRLSTTF